MPTFRRYCYKCQRRTPHTRFLDRFGHQRDACTCCEHVNATWHAEYLRPRERPLGATLRKAA